MYIRYFLAFCLFSFSSSHILASMGRFGGWSNLHKSGTPSAEQIKNAEFDDVPEALSVDSKPRGSISEQSSKNMGILYTAEDKYKLPPVVFDEVYSDMNVVDNKKLKVKPINAIDGLNILETGTYIAN